MLFVKRDELKTGMRLARPIYNRDGVLLYERNSKLTAQGIVSIKNFGLIGLFILEPAEPVPPMTQADIDFERFQTMSVFSIQDELNRILKTQRLNKMPMIAANIIKNYGNLGEKINFVQNLRSREDYIYKHSLNVAILCALISRTLRMRADEQLETVQAAIVHDIGKLGLPKHLLDEGTVTLEERTNAQEAEVRGHTLIENAFSSPNVKRICSQAYRIRESLRTGEDVTSMKMLNGAKVLAVAEAYDTMTAVQVEKAPESEVAVIKHLIGRPNTYDSMVVTGLIRAINILVPGVSVELNTREKAVVITANEQNVLEPMILMFGDNTVRDLSDRKTYGDMEIKDIMKTMDNRHVMDIDMLRKNGFQVKEPDDVQVTS